MSSLQDRIEESARDRAKYQVNRDAILAKKRAYYLANRDRIKLRVAAYKKDHCLTINDELGVLLERYARQEKITIRTAVNELLRQSLGAFQ